MSPDRLVRVGSLDAGTPQTLPPSSAGAPTRFPQVREAHPPTDDPRDLDRAMGAVTELSSGATSGLPPPAAVRAGYVELNEPARRRGSPSRACRGPFLRRPRPRPGPTACRRGRLNAPRALPGHRRAVRCGARRDADNAGERKEERGERQKEKRRHVPTSHSRTPRGVGSAPTAGGHLVLVKRKGKACSYRLPAARR